jgi:ribosomal protein S18 acetylase RimI-like enzyme
MTSTHTDTAPERTAPTRLHWVPVRSLAERHRPRILSHLLALPPQDRHLRFGYAASDVQVARYVEQIDFARDEVFGIFNRKLELIAQAHLAGLPERREAEFGVSVLPHARGRGYGGRLFDHAVLHARNRGVDTLLVHVLAENTAMLKIVRNAGAKVERDGGEALARVRLPGEDFRSRLDALVEDGAAEIDYHLKLQARRVADALEVIDEVKTQLRELRPPTTPE